MDITQDIPTQIINPPPPKAPPMTPGPISPMPPGIMPAEKPAKAEHPEFERNREWALPHPGNYVTQLPPAQEAKFQAWVKQNKVPWTDGPQSDYDMRGFYQALQNKDPNALTAVNPNDNKLHYPDTWKTPYHKSFSRESQYAKPNAPKWNEKDQLVLDDGTIVFDERAEAKKKRR